MFCTEKQISNGFVIQHQGKRPHQEDRWIHFEHNGWMLAGVLDGHGGHAVSESLVLMIPIALLNALPPPTNDLKREDVCAFVSKAFQATDEFLFSKDHKRYQHQGST